MLNNKGFSLVELLAVMIILALLLSFSLPKISNTIKNAKLLADIENVEVLNSITERYKLESELRGSEIFIGSDTALEKIEELKNENYLSIIPKPQLTGNEFLWDSYYQKWYYSLYPLNSPYVFGNSDTDQYQHADFVYTNSWDTNEESISSNYGRLFIPANYDEYSIIATARLSDYSGGYGIFLKLI